MSINQIAFLDMATKEDRLRIHAFTNLVFHLCLRINKSDGVSTSLCGIASADHIAEYQDYHSDRIGTAEKPKANSFSSRGFFYDEASIAVMKAAGFPTLPSIATSVNYCAPVYTKEKDGTITNHFNDASPHPLKQIADYFDSMDVRTFIVSGGHFPNETKHSAIVIDVNDPNFISKVRDPVLEIFHFEATEMLSTPNHMHTSKDYLAYCASILEKLSEYAKQKGVEDLDLTESWDRNDVVIAIKDIPEHADTQADYQLKWVTGVLDPILYGIEPRIIGEIIMDIAVTFKANPTLRKHLMLDRQRGLSKSYE